MEYKEFIELLTNGKIKSLRFSLKDYAHYRDCLMEYERDSQGTMSTLIIFTLTRDGAEKISFYKSFNEKEKIFNLGRAGKYTLAQMWKRIIINDIEYYRKGAYMKKLKSILIIMAILTLALCLCLCSFTCDNYEGKFEATKTEKGRVSGNFTFKIDASATYHIYFGNENGERLEGYTPVASFIIDEETKEKTVTVTDLIIPTKATTFVLFDGDNQIYLDKGKILKIPEECLNSSSIDYTFGALSDVHYNKYNGFEKGDDANIALPLALDILKAHGVDFVGIAGDISNNGEESAFTKLNEDISAYDFEVLSVTGNHDVTALENGYWQTHMTQKYKNLEGVCDFADNGYDFIYLPPEDENGSDAFIFLSQTYWDYKRLTSRLLTNEQLEWLQAMATKYKDRTIYLFFHSFLYGTDKKPYTGVGNIKNPGGYYYDIPYKYGTEDERVFRRILKENKNIVFLSGHSHWTFEMEKYNEHTNFWDFDGEYCTMVHVPSVTAPRTIEDNDTERTSLAGESSQGWIIYVYDDYVIFEPHDFLNGRIYTEYMEILYTK